VAVCLDIAFQAEAIVGIEHLMNGRDHLADSVVALAVAMRIEIAAIRGRGLGYKLASGARIAFVPCGDVTVNHFFDVAHLRRSFWLRIRLFAFRRMRCVCRIYPPHSSSASITCEVIGSAFKSGPWLATAEAHK